MHGIGGDSLILAAAFFYSVVFFLLLGCDATLICVCQLSAEFLLFCCTPPIGPGYGLQVTIRLGGYARKFVPVRLAASKSFALAIIAVAWLLCTALFDTVNARSTDYWSGWNNPWAVLAVVWSALGPGALVAFLQSQVQMLFDALVYRSCCC